MKKLVIVGMIILTVSVSGYATKVERVKRDKLVDISGESNDYGAMEDGPHFLYYENGVILVHRRMTERKSWFERFFENHSGDGGRSSYASSDKSQRSALPQSHGLCSGPRGCGPTEFLSFDTKIRPWPADARLCHPDHGAL